jgi:DNA-binding transcriptional LysR family regulator
MEEAFSEQRLVLPRPRVETVSVAAIQAHLRMTDCLAPLTGQVAEFYTSLGLLSRVALTPVSRFADLGMIWAESSSNPLLCEFTGALKKQAKGAKISSASA